MPNIRGPLAVALGLLAVGAPLARAGELIVNGDFATGDTSGWDWTPDPEGGAYQRPRVESFEGKNFFVINFGPAQRLNNLEFGGRLGQEIDVVGGQTYLFSGTMYLRNVSNFRVGEAGAIEVEVEDNELAALEFEEIDAGELIRGSFAFHWAPGADGPIDLEFHFGRVFPNLDDSGGELINAMITDISVTEVPAPAPAAALGIAGLLMSRRRR